LWKLRVENPTTEDIPISIVLPSLFNLVLEILLVIFKLSAILIDPLRPYIGPWIVVIPTTFKLFTFKKKQFYNSTLSLPLISNNTNTLKIRFLI
jgi:hypothetical protein